MKNAFFHLGYPKTGTSTLQSFLFPFIDEVKFIGTHHFGKKVKLITDIRDYPSEKIRNHNLAEYRNVNILISDESLMPSQEFTTNPNYLKQTCSRISTNIKKEFSPYFNVKIIFVIRRQDSMVLSQFSQFYPWYMRNKETSTFKAYLDNFLDLSYQNSLREALNYYKIYEIYRDNFSPEAVEVLVFEELKNNERAYYNRWFDLLSINREKYISMVTGKSANKKSTNGKISRVQETTLLAGLSRFKAKYFPSINIKGTALKRTLNKVVIANNQSVIDSMQMSDQEKKQIIEYYTHFNKQLSEEKGLELDKYGYY